MLVTPALIITWAVGGAVSTLAGIAVRRLYKKVTHLEAMSNVAQLDTQKEEGSTSA